MYAKPEQKEAVLPYLSDELVHVICQDLDMEDLLCLRRVSRRMRSLVDTCDEAWHRLHDELVSNSLGKGTISTITPAAQQTCTQQQSREWAQVFKHRYTADKRRMRLKQHIRRMQLQSARAELEKAVRHVHDEERHERSRLASIEAELRGLDRARQAGVASQAWTPVAVQRHFDRIIQQAPVEGNWRLIALRQDAHLCRQQLLLLSKRGVASQRELDVVHRKLQRLQCT